MLKSIPTVTVALLKGPKTASPSASTRDSLMTTQLVDVITSVERRRRWSVMEGAAGRALYTLKYVATMTTKILAGMLD